MRLGVISDTHDNVRAVERAVSVFEREGCDTLVHCGDFIAPPVLPFFEGFEVHGVLGNNDGELDGLEAGFRALGREANSTVVAPTSRSTARASPSSTASRSTT